MGASTQNEQQKRWAAEELTRTVCKLWLLSGKTQEQLAELMGYGRRVVAGMCNYRYGEELYPARRLSSFLNATGVYRHEDVVRVFKAYDMVAGRMTMLDQIRVHYDVDRHEWIREEIDPVTEEVQVNRRQQRQIAQLLHST